MRDFAALEIDLDQMALDIQSRPDLFGKFDHLVVPHWLRTTCQTETAIELGFSQGRVRHRVLRALRGCLTASGSTGLPKAIYKSDGVPEGSLEPWAKYARGIRLLMAQRGAILREGVNKMRGDHYTAELCAHIRATRKPRWDRRIR
jgi:hypothetical protein